MSRPMPPHLRRQAGFTLAEILVTTAIFAVIMIAALAVYDRSNKVFKSSSEAADLQQSTRIGFDKLMSEVRMLGFDYSRGGVPTGPGQFQQPDEQIEYAGMNVLAFRSNLDYVTNAANGNGLAPPSYTAVNPATNLPYFPFITTTNEEIIIYALRSADPSANNGSISFWTDAAIPRAGYPGGSPETRITVSGIDTTNDHPPYTLYRMTAADILANRPGTPIAENIRSLNFSYYTDAKGSAVLKEAVTGNPITASRNADGTTVPVPSDSGAIGGAGQYDPSNIGGTANFSDRDRRALVVSMRVSIVGMNPIADLNYQNPTETNPSFRNFREYSLQALVVPRNLGLTGFPEPSFDHPGPPTITGICTGYCGAPVICWDPPTTGGPVDKFTIAWDTNPLGSFTQHSIDVYDPAATSAILPDDGVSDISQPFYYQITAVNDNGSSTPSGQEKATPLESTKPRLDDSTTTLVATDPTHANTQANQITLNWQVPKINTAQTQNLNCTGNACNSNGLNIPLTQETKLWEVWRSTDPSTAGVKILSITSVSKQPGTAVPGATVTWVDSAATSEVPPASCVQYYYRIRMASRCAKNDAWNVGNTAGRAADFVSEYFPAVKPGVQNGIPGFANSTSVPAAPVGLAADTIKSSCPPNGIGNCDIFLKWSPVVTDTNNNPIGVDVYRVTRSRKLSTDPSFSPDPNFTPVDIGGYSQNTSGTMTYEDKTAPASDNCGTCSGLPWYYQYTVAAKVCTNYGAESNPAVYPTPCSINPVIIQQGQQGSNAGLTPQTAWVFNAGDTISTSAPSGGPALKSVEYYVTAYPGGGLVDDVTISPSNGSGSSFVYTWANQAQGTYRVLVIATNVNNCTEVQVRYVSEQPPAGCAFLPLATLPSVSLTKQKSNDFATMDFQLTNGGAENMKFTIFTGKVSTTWSDPDTKHSDLVWNGIQYTANGSQTQDLFNDPPSGTIGTQTLTTVRTEPVNLADVPANKQLTLRYTWTYNTASGKPDPDLKTSPVQKLCIQYQIASEPGVTKSCNLVGQAAKTQNPNACD